MIINEKGLLRAMKNAAKSGGYKLFMDGPWELVLFTARWFIRLDAEFLPRKVAALIVEHTGKLPEAGDSMWVTEKEDPQIILEDTMREEIRSRTAGEGLGEALLVPLFFKGYQLFQTQDRRCWAADPGTLGLLDRARVEKGSAIVIQGGGILWSGNASEVVVPVLRPEDGEGHDEFLAAWKALESVAWPRK